MAPPSASPKAVTRPRRSQQASGKSSEEHNAAASTPTSASATIAKSDSELAKVFRSDLQSIRTLVTCTICDQLLYEPWTLACGHTYCYSCLCNWFLPNRRKKTCPDCRKLVRQMPAPAFLIKQMMEIFLNRTELMPIDETADQHRERRRSESNMVVADRATEAGLFKGCFNKHPLSTLLCDEEDRIYRCSRCAHEYIGGPMCENCGMDLGGDEEDIDIDDFSDVDDEDLVPSVNNFGYHVDIDAETDEDLADLEEIDEAGQDVQFSGSAADYGIPSVIWASSRISRHLRPMQRISPDTSSSESDEEEEIESMRDFIEDDEGHYEISGSYRSPSSASHVSLSSRGTESVAADEDNDDEYDEGGEVSDGRRRARGAWMAADQVTTRAASVVTVTDSATTSEAGDLDEDSRRLQETGWSPLEPEHDSDYGEHEPFVTRINSEDSDTETTVGNLASDEEEGDRQQDCGSPTPLWEPSPSPSPYFHNGGREQSVHSVTTEEHSGHSEVDEYDSDVQGTSVTDRDGDVEMSVSPVSSRRSSAESSDLDRRPRRSVEILGSANAVHEVKDDSSDGTVQPAARRRRQVRYSHHSHTSEYDPRISMMFAQHQSDLRDVTARQSPYFEPASRTRTSVSYRLVPTRVHGSSNNSHPSSTVLLTSVSNRPNRVQRQYRGRYFH